MVNLKGFVSKQMQLAVPEIPFTPTEVQPSVSVPMVYVETCERVEYCVKTLEISDAAVLESELNKLGSDGWWLIQIISQKKSFLYLFGRKATN